jgi:polar amino acid transport system substrate-binding protein
MCQRPDYHRTRVPGLKSWALGLVLALAAGGALAADNTVLQIATENTPPASMEQDGKVVGYITEIVREIMRRTATDYTIRVLPWMRAYTLAQENANACVYSTSRVDDREGLFKWIGPLDVSDWVLFARADRKLKINSLDDVRGMRIGTYLGDAREHFLRERGLLLDLSPNELDNPRKLMGNRIDLWASSLKWGTAAIDRQGFAGQIVPVLTFNRVKVYLACNLSMPDRLADSLNAAMRAMEKDGSSAAIVRKYASWMLPP